MSQVATIAGNLMLKNKHADFPSDVFITLEAAQAELCIGMYTKITITNYKALMF